jgi:Cft2 family RNA processing exonuclease
MSKLGFHYENQSLHFPELGLWMDPHHRVRGEEFAVVTHAHSDHTAAHDQVILTGPTQELMRARVGGKRLEQVLDFGRRYNLGELTHLPGNSDIGITLLPAGHILGSAMVLLENSDDSLLYTGDFKIRRGLTAEPCEIRPARTLIMETTFGLPKYVFPPIESIRHSIIDFCKSTTSTGGTAVLSTYSLGKSQEVLRLLADSNLPIVLGRHAMELTRIYERFGEQFPSYGEWNGEPVPGKVLIGPHRIVDATVRDRLGNCKIAGISGWALDSSYKYQTKSDVAFPLSDHADFLELLEMVNQVHPTRVFTVHGFTGPFASFLRRRGFDAAALGQSEQLELSLSGF